MSTKVFKMSHLMFDVDSIFTEFDPPKWLISKEYNWFWEKYVLTLDVGKSIKTDFQEIERIE